MLLLHVASSVALLGAIACFLVLAVLGTTTANEQMLRTAFTAMQILTTTVIVPLALIGLVSGIIQALGTSWGLFQNYWVLIKLVVTVFAVTILLIKTQLIAKAALLASVSVLPLAELQSAGAQLVFHSAAGLLVLLVPMVLSIFKPKGKTRYGWKKAQKQSASNMA